MEEHELAHLRENDYLYEFQDQNLIGNDKQVQDLKKGIERLKSQAAKSEEGKVQELQQRVKELEHTKSRLTKLHWGLYGAREKEVDILSEKIRVVEYSITVKTSSPSMSDVDRYFLVRQTNSDTDESSSNISAARAQKLQALETRFEELDSQEATCSTCFAEVDHLLRGQDPKLDQAESLLERLPEVSRYGDPPSP